MYCSNLTSRASSRPSISSTNSLSNPLLRLPEMFPANNRSQSSLPFTRIHCGLRQLRKRIDSAKNTQKITEAMKLVAAAKVRRAQEAVISVIKRVESRMAELEDLGVDYTVISVGEKGNSYFRRRNNVSVDRFIEGRGFPTAKEAQIVADYVYSLFVSEEVDKVELVYTKFMSFFRSDPVIQTLLPLSMKGEIQDVNGNCVDVMEDELFRLTTKEGKLTVERDRVRAIREGISPLMEFEQDPILILDAMMPLYLNSQILRALQESLASELASRMNAMSTATDNAVELRKSLLIAYNQERQAKITGEILEIVAGADALTVD
ncbi:hypothetical protein SLA2020_473650 [Shorea laevis]